MSVLPCVACGTSLHPVFPQDADDTQPLRATVFTSHGNYGSTVFDPASDHERLLVNICDNCLESRLRDGSVRYERVLRYEHRTWIQADWPPGEP